MAKGLEPLIKFWPVLVAAIGLLWQGGVLTADMKRDREMFLERLESQSRAIAVQAKSSEEYTSRVTLLLETVIPDWRERLARVEERVRALEQKGR